MVMRAFTLIELLAVILIISLLAGLLIAGLGMLRKHEKSSRTRLICVQLKDGLVRSGRGAAALSLHPFASTASPRAAFCRGEGAPAGVAAGDVLDAAAEALRAPLRRSSDGTWNLYAMDPVLRPRCIDASDRFCR